MSDVTDLKAEVLLLRKENKELRDENKALLELCKDLWRCFPKSNCEWDMDANLCTGYDKCHGECGLWARLRKHGAIA